MNILITEKEFQECRKLKQEKEDLIKKPKVIVQNKLKEITEEYHKLDKKNLNTANIITHQYNSMRTILEEVLSELKEGDSNESIRNINA